MPEACFSDKENWATQLDFYFDITASIPNDCHELNLARQNVNCSHIMTYTELSALATLKCT